jgi:hypothetical protein
MCARRGPFSAHRDPPPARKQVSQRIGDHMSGRALSPELGWCSSVKCRGESFERHERTCQRTCRGCEVALRTQRISPVDTGYVDDRFGGIHSEREPKNRAIRLKRETTTGSFLSIFISGMDQKKPAGVFTGGSQDLIEVFRFCGESVENSTASQRDCLTDFIQFREVLSRSSKRRIQTLRKVSGGKIAHRSGQRINTLAIHSESVRLGKTLPGKSAGRFIKCK